MSIVIPKELSKYVSIKNKKINDFTIKTFIVRPSGRPYLDDNTYKKFPILVNLIPRACSELYHNNNLILTLKGIPKFSGTSIIDNDDYNDNENKEEKENEEYKDKEYKENDIVIDPSWNLEVKYKCKENGKFAIFKLFTFNDELWIFGGSKNCHIPIKYSDIPTIQNQDLHYNILKEFYNDTHNKNLDYIINKEIIAEYVDGKHIVYTEKPYLVYFNEFLDNTFRKVSNICEPTNEIPSNELLIKIRQMKGIEGIVIEYHNKNDNQIIRQKHKTNWYILYRSFREIMTKCSKKTISKENLIKKLHNNIDNKSNNYIRLSEEDTKYWKNTATNFIEFLQTTDYDYSDASFDKIGIAKMIHEFEKLPFL